MKNMGEWRRREYGKKWHIECLFIEFTMNSHWLELWQSHARGQSHLATCHSILTAYRGETRGWLRVASATPKNKKLLGYPWNFYKITKVYILYIFIWEYNYQ
jgi:hypothetical protein